jgi:hypothetical protein
MITLKTDESRDIRNRLAALESYLSTLEGSRPIGSICGVGKTTTIASYPSSASPIVYALIPQNVVGAEIEGSTPTISDGTGHLFAVNLGPDIPPAGTWVIYHEVPAGVFIFSYKN